MIALTGDIIIPALAAVFGSIAVAWLGVVASRGRKAAEAADATATANAKQLVPNGGNSLRDAVDETNRTMARLGTTLAEMASRRDEQMGALHRTIELHATTSAIRHRHHAERLTALESAIHPQETNHE